MMTGRDALCMRVLRALMGGTRGGAMSVRALAMRMT